MKKLTKSNFFITACMMYVACMLTANILAVKVFQLFPGMTLPAGVFIFPFTYILGDIFAEVYGYEKTKKVVFAGFGLNLFSLVFQQIALWLPSPDYMLETGNAFRTIFASTPRVLLAGFVAYIVGALSNAKLMQFLKSKFEKKLALRCMLSTVVGESLDALIFCSIGFLFTMPFNAVLLMIVGQAVMKTLVEFVIYPLTRFCILKVKELA